MTNSEDNLETSPYGRRDEDKPRNALGIKNWKTALAGILIAVGTVAQDGGFDVRSVQFWINIIAAIGLVLAKDAGVTGTGR